MGMPSRQAFALAPSTSCVPAPVLRAALLRGAGGIVAVDQDAIIGRSGTSTLPKLVRYSKVEFQQA